MTKTDIIQRLLDSKTPDGYGAKWYDTDMINDIVKELHKEVNETITGTPLKTCPKCGMVGYDFSKHIISCKGCSKILYQSVDD